MHRKFQVLKRCLIISDVSIRCIKNNEIYCLKVTDVYLDLLQCGIRGSVEYGIQKNVAKSAGKKNRCTTQEKRVM
jgi:hypothetical protein